MSDENPINVLVRDPEWQDLRKSFLGKWKSQPVALVDKLRRYLGPMQETSYDKIKVVMNYLTGTGFRTGRIKHPSITLLRKDLISERERRVADGTWSS